MHWELAGFIQPAESGFGHRLDGEAAGAISELAQGRNGMVDDVVANESPIPALVDQLLAGDHAPFALPEGN